MKTFTMNTLKHHGNRMIKLTLGFYATWHSFSKPGIKKSPAPAPATTHRAVRAGLDPLRKSSYTFLSIRFRLIIYN